MHPYSVMGCLVLSLVSPLSHAEVYDATTFCTSCSQSMAGSAALNLTGPDVKAYVYVADYGSENLWRFLVESRSDGGKVVKTATPVEVENDDEVKDIFYKWLQIKNLPDEVTRKVTEFADIQSVYDLPVNSQKKNLIATYLYENLPMLFDFPMEIISDRYTQISHAAIVYYGENKNINVKVDFGDSSSALYKLEFPAYMNKTDVKFEIVKDSLSDSLGNLIPYSSNALRYKEGKLIISQASQNEFSLWKSWTKQLGFELVGDWEQEYNASCQYRCSYKKCELDCPQN